MRGSTSPRALFMREQVQRTRATPPRTRHTLFACIRIPVRDGPYTVYCSCRLEVGKRSICQRVVPVNDTSGPYEKRLERSLEASANQSNLSGKAAWSGVRVFDGGQTAAESSRDAHSVGRTAVCLTSRMVRSHGDKLSFFCACRQLAAGTPNRVSAADSTCEKPMEGEPVAGAL